jgi:membrane protease YdiL (CAAX protease family)
MSLAPISTITESASRTVPGVKQDNLRWFELGLVLLVAFGGYMANSIHVLTYGPAHSPGFTNERWFLSGVHELSCLALLGYVLHRRKLRFRDLGLNWSVRYVGMGAGLFVVASVAHSLGLWLIHWGQQLTTGSYVNPVHPAQIFGHASTFAFLFALVNPFFEELIVRAYLMSEVSALTGSMRLAALVSVLFQSSYHLYYGWTGAAALSFLFLVFAIFYARTRNATPVIVAHLIFDVVGIAYLAH